MNTNHPGSRSYQRTTDRIITGAMAMLAVYAVAMAAILI